MAKSQSQQSEAKRPSGPGTKLKMKSVDVGRSVAKIPSKTIATSPNSHKRGKQGE